LLQWHLDIKRLKSWSILCRRPEGPKTSGPKTVKFADRAPAPTRPNRFSAFPPCPLRRAAPPHRFALFASRCMCCSFQFVFSRLCAKDLASKISLQRQNYFICRSVTVPSCPSLQSFPLGRSRTNFSILIYIPLFSHHGKQQITRRAR
jgi:hypothetical protein